MKILGIIPARGGSKSIPLKNIKKLLNKPLIAWTIESALESNLDRILVTTDDKRIAGIAKKFGADVPFIRPKELATDITGIEPVIKHALNWLKENENYVPDAVALMMPTTPLRPAKHINGAIELFKKTKADSVVAVYEVIANENPHWMLKINDKNRVVLFTGEPLTKIKTRRQELPICYSRNDIIYIFKPKNLYGKTPNLYGKKVELYLMDEFYSIDINTEEDWFVCEQKLKKLRKLEKNGFKLP
ncbi:MAG: acylneuraminate cytidylyltransferase family protein [Patescibacteria group bacterium]|nr:acylneuraminate cytidylyltransferase family protein [Patescibacteria group bacterium]